ncbi:hypothetical protein E4K10_04945 [Streptomyces sp. T1317-0309]|nr:hypothetical protein E4K10_04945 [Streptomyces sp. T1317-0309]
MSARTRVRTGTRIPRPVVALAAAGALVTAVLGAAGPASAASPGTETASAQVASGDGWTVTRGAAGYTVSLRLGSPLPIRDDMPELVADGLDLGPAAESADGRTLTATTTDPAVAKASSIAWQWSTGGSSTATGPTSLPSAADQLAAQRRTLAKGGKDGHPSPYHPGGNGNTPADPTTVGHGSYTVADYDFGAQSIALADIGGIRGELEGRIYVPTDHRPHPLVIFLHGRQLLLQHHHAQGRQRLALPGRHHAHPQLRRLRRRRRGARRGGLHGGVDLGERDQRERQPALPRRRSRHPRQARAGHADDAQGGQRRPLRQLPRRRHGPGRRLRPGAGGRDARRTPKARMTARQFAGSLDFNSIGLMGHSRGGEGVVTAATLNEGLPHPWAIKSVFAPRRSTSPASRCRTSSPPRCCRTAMATCPTSRASTSTPTRATVRSPTTCSGPTSG